MTQYFKDNYNFWRLYHIVFGEKFYKKLYFLNSWDGLPRRWNILQNIINIKKYKSYLEIGCDEDALFSKINIENKIGIDPVQGGNQRITSDDFFKKNKKNFDIIFIDGLHEYDQVRKDIFNSLNFLKKDGMILLHDCLPSDYFSQAVPRSRHLWCGDVWKNIVEIRTLP